MRGPSWAKLLVLSTLVALFDYATNEPITDGTANLAYLLSALAPSR